VVVVERLHGVAALALRRGRGWRCGSPVIVPALAVAAGSGPAGGGRPVA
jgi:hypothetical protein